MDKLLILTTLLAYSHCSPLGSPSTITAEVASPNCGNRLTNLIETCLIPFEQKLVVYRAPDTTDGVKQRMRAAFCHQYEETLQCLHTVLLQCPSPPALAHLNIIERRVGYLRSFMDTTCRVPLEAMTPKPTTTRRPTTHRTSSRRPTSLTSLATLIKTAAMDPTTPRLIIAPKSTVEGSTVQPSSHPKSRTIRPQPTYDVRVVTDKINGLRQTNEGEFKITPTPKIEVDLRDYDKTENDIPVDNVVLPNIETSAIEDNIIRVSNPVNCDTKLGHENNPRCSMSLAQSSSSAIKSTALTIIALFVTSLLL